MPPFSPSTCASAASHNGIPRAPGKSTTHLWCAAKALREYRETRRRQSRRPSPIQKSAVLFHWWCYSKHPSDWASIEYS